MRLLGQIGLAVLLAGGSLRASVGIALYESRALDARRTQTGHAALVLTDVCADGISKVRACKASELPGVVVNRYAGLAAGLDLQLLVMPLMPHFNAVTRAEDEPVLTTGAILKSLQLDYWRMHLQTEIPALSQEEYERLEAARRKATFGKELKYIGQFEFLTSALARPKNLEKTEPLALRDPVTGLLVRNGRWRTLVGASHERDVYLLLTPSTVEQELKINALLASEQTKTFNAASSNCADFVQRGLSFLLPDSPFKGRPRGLDFADAFIRSPITVASDFAHYLKRNSLPLQTYFVPQLSGTRVASMGLRTTAGGALNPLPEQGLLAFGIKCALLQINYLVPALAFAADRAARNISPERQVTLAAAGNFDLSAPHEAGPAAEGLDLKEMQARRFGADACWSQRRKQFADVLAWAQENQIISIEAAKIGTRRSKPEAMAKQLEREGVETVPLPALLGAVSYELERQPLSRNTLDKVDELWLRMSGALKARGYPQYMNLVESLTACSVEMYERNPAKFISARNRAQQPLPTVVRQVNSLLHATVR